MYSQVFILAILGCAFAAPAPQLLATKAAGGAAAAPKAATPAAAPGAAGALGGLGGLGGAGGGAGGLLDGVFKTAGVDAPIDLSVLGNPAGAVGGGGAAPVSPNNNFANAAGASPAVPGAKKP